VSAAGTSYALAKQEYIYLCIAAPMKGRKENKVASVREPSSSSSLSLPLVSEQQSTDWLACLHLFLDQILIDVCRIRANYEHSPEGLVPKDELHAAYAAYCASIGRQPRQVAAFGKIVRVN
jgi:hypothetical protein